MFWISLLTILFLLAIMIDVTPYLRGPSYYPPEWRWHYDFTNTLDKIWLPLLVVGSSILLFFQVEKKKSFFLSHTKLLLTFLVLLSFFLQISLLFFSRSGVSVLIHRIINPDLNSYFTAALSINNPFEFLRRYNELLLTFVYHARSHPPGAILLFYWIDQVMRHAPFLTDFVNHISPSHHDVRVLWQTLLPSQKATAVFSGFFIPFLSGLSLIPLYYTAVLLYGSKIALRASFLYLFIPSIVFFIPINDVVLPFFSIAAFFFLVYGLKKNNTLSFFFSGLILFCGVFFNLALLPLLLFFFVFFLWSMYEKKTAWSKEFFLTGLLFIWGFLVLPLSLYGFLQFNFLEMIRVIMEDVPHVHTRSYLLWLFFNLYDFFVFSGIPVTLVFLRAVGDIFIQLIKKQWQKMDPLVVSFLFMLLLVDLSGSVRGETGRIWSIYMPFMVLIAARFVTNKLKFSTNFFALFLLLQVLQLLVMQEFWVMMW